MSENVMSYTQKQGKQGNDPVSAKPGRNIHRKNSSPIEQVKFLHRNLGNQAVQRLFKSGTIQAKLKIGKANDKYEQEADQVADQVMRMPEPNESLVIGHSSLVQRKSTCPECMEEEEAIQTKPIADQITPLVQRQPLEEEKEEEEEKIIQPRPIAEQITPLVQREPLDELKEEEEEEPDQFNTMDNILLQRQFKEPGEEEEDEELVNLKSKGESGVSHRVTPAIESNISSLKGRGQPLPESTRTFFEPRFGYDFSKVRVHTDAKAAETAKSINAKAFTTGKDVVFGAGQYSPGTSIGRGLLAHELIHVLQQEKSLNRILRIKKDKPNHKTDEKDQDDFFTLQAAHTTGKKPEAEFQWLEEVASQTGMAPDAAKDWLEDVANTIDRTPKATWEWLKEVKSRTFMAPYEAWGWLDNLAYRNGMVPGDAWKLIDDVAIQTNMLPVEAWEWLDNIADRNSMAPDVAWEWLEDVASYRIDRSPYAAWEWLNVVESRTFMAPYEAWVWLDNLAYRKGMAPDDAWKLIDDVAIQTNMLPDVAWEWLDNIADRNGTAPGVAWEWLEGVANRIDRSPYAAWEWLNEVERHTSMAPVGAWVWLINVAFKIEMAPDKAWRWLKELGAKIKMAPDEAWVWLINVALEIGIEPKKVLKLIEEVTPAYIPTPFAKAHRFKDRGELEARRRVWNLVLLIMEKTNKGKPIIDWLVGKRGLKESKGKISDYSQKVINAAIKEAKIQMSGLLNSLEVWILRQPKINLPSKMIVGGKGKYGKYGYRSAKDQNRIWLEKYYFISENFDRITMEAQKKCIEDLEVKNMYKNIKSSYESRYNRKFSSLKNIFTPGLMWNPSGKTKLKNRLISLGITKEVGPIERRNIREIHYKCWLKLTPEERQREILQASSAPGISRHHWGTDVDILSVEREDWEKGGKYYKVYEWLKKNAWEYGFMQPYIPRPSGSKAYMEERWHWSYYPISSVLLEIAKTKKTELDKKLGNMWQEYYDNRETTLLKVKGLGVEKKRKRKKKIEEIKGDPYKYLRKEVQGQYKKIWMYYVFSVKEEPWR